MYKKPPLPTIKINGLIFIKQIDVDCLKVSFYRCSNPQLEVKIYWCSAYGKFRVAGGVIDFTIKQDLTDNLVIPETHISNYFTPKQEKALDRYLTEVMLSVENK